MFWYIFVAVLLITGALIIGLDFKKQQQRADNEAPKSKLTYLAGYPLLALSISIGLRLFFGGNFTVIGVFMFPLALFVFGVMQVKRGNTK
ncbi:hypothetical protein [Alkalicoccus daliensis]|uniref:Uncharacterized protein n=1 Tax=Alkalicoccus daliensis TaxID=745820 RepID=A0A1G9Z9P0_9BACI|nr:hypothetical protein [Alkalicoccus daliensis]SDN18152.1 hypothetical protein SAMN04488053_10117 [Alkalicoccus daliensis]